MDDPVSSEDFLQREILQPLNIPPERYISFQSDPPDPQAECQRIGAELTARGPVDLMILGVGQNGHIGLNEPAGELVVGAHIAELAATTRSHAMLASRAVPLLQGVTLGVGDIFAARKVILLVTGERKADALAAFDKGMLTTHWPVTLLHLHADLLCLFERSHV
jgi:galactosamine-6-phosphate isomerase